jgi:hypothetical protein
MGLGERERNEPQKSESLDPLEPGRENQEDLNWFKPPHQHPQ